MGDYVSLASLHKYWNLTTFWQERTSHKWKVKTVKTGQVDSSSQSEAAEHDNEKCELPAALTLHGK